MVAVLAGVLDAEFHSARIAEKADATRPTASNRVALGRPLLRIAVWSHASLVVVHTDDASLEVGLHPRTWAFTVLASRLIALLSACECPTQSRFAPVAYSAQHPFLLDPFGFALCFQISINLIKT
jgi:hypothetical protein